VATTRRARSVAAVRVVQISVTGLSREAVLQAVAEPVEAKGAAKTKKESRQILAEGVMASSAPAAELDVVSERVADEVEHKADKLVDVREKEEEEVEAKAEYIVLHLSPARLQAFLKRLNALDGDVTVSALPAGRAGEDSIEIQIQLK
jgi:hypothetical protein